MTSTAASVDWRKLREFVGVDLTQSYILSWQFEGGSLAMDVDLLLTPEHPNYETPRPAEKVCIRAAIIEFPYCESVRIAGMETEATPAEAVKHLGHGVIVGLRRVAEGPFELSGEFGTVLIDAERPILRMSARSARVE